MNNLLQYLAESSLALLLFYILYALLLSRQTCFGFNRFYLLTALLLSLVIPFLELPAWPTETALPVKSTSTFSQAEPAVLNQSTISAASITKVKVPVSNTWFYITYAIGFFASGLLFCRQLLKLYAFIYNHLPKGYYWQRIKIIPTHGEIATSSFLHYILFDNSQPYTPAERELILRHERAHIVQKHTYDILYLKILTIIFWFNPLLFLYKKALESTHEYLADAKVLRDQNHEKYVALLVQQVVGKTGFPLGSFFFLNRTITLNRIDMLKKINHRAPLTRPLIVIPLVCALALTFASNRPVDWPAVKPTSVTGDKSAKSTSIWEKDINNWLGVNGSKNKLQQPEFPGGEQQLYRFFLQNLKFTPEALEKHNFIGMRIEINIDKEGNPEITIPDNEGLKGREISSIIKAMPRWTPALLEGNAIASKHIVTIDFDWKIEEPEIKPNHFKATGLLNLEGIPVFGSDIICINLNSVVGSPDNFSEEKAIAIDELIKPELTSSPKPIQEKVYSFADQQPRFPGGEEARNKFIKDNLKSPVKAVKDGIDWMVVAQFTVDSKGAIKDIAVVQSDITRHSKSWLEKSKKPVNLEKYKPLRKEMDAEVIRLVKLMPNFASAQDNGKIVAFRYTLPVVFRL